MSEIIAPTPFADPSAPSVPDTTVAQAPATAEVPVSPAPVSATPHPKVIAAGLAGALTTLIIFTVQQVFHQEVPGDVSAALTTIIAAAAGYLTSSH